MTSLIIHEGERLSRDELCKRAHALLQDDQDANAAIEELLALQLKVTHSREVFLGLADADAETDAEDADVDGEGDEQPGTPVPLFDRRGDRYSVRHLVGSGRLPTSGLVFEVLPKVRANAAPQTNRLALRRMWSFASDLQLRDDDQRHAIGAADDMPLHEWLAARFIHQVEDLFRRGIRRQYLEREENLYAARGRMLPLDNLRHNLVAPHRLYCRFEELSPDRPENRLIRSALAVLAHGCRDEDNRRRAMSLADRMHEVPRSSDVRRDLAQWRDDRLMKDYREIRGACRWILLRQGVSPVRGDDEMIGCFARMNDVFERYVVRWLAQKCPADGRSVVVLDQTCPAAHGLRIKNFWRWGSSAPAVGSWRPLRPDMVAFERSGTGLHGPCLVVLDAKWKHRPKSGPIARGDMYQMYTYARYWFPDGADDRLERRIGLVYPCTEKDRTVERFTFDGMADVIGLALPFLLPTSDDGRRWVEGINPATLFPSPASSLPTT